MYLFSEGNKDMRDLLGGKGANLAEMTNIGLPVPQGFVITTEACTRYYNDGEEIDPIIIEEIFQNMQKLESITGKRFGDSVNPLLVSIRSGSRASMPGMMDTVLNLGINDDVAKGMIEATKNPRFVYDIYRRFIQMFGDVVMGHDSNAYEHILESVKKQRGISLDADLNADDFEQIVHLFKAHYEHEEGKAFPSDAKDQLIEAVCSVFKSWNNPRAHAYRRMNEIPSSWGTAVNVQSMVFGNIGETSGTGVAFTRNPATGEKKLFGEYIMNAQGEDIVAGTRTPQPISDLESQMPSVYEEFKTISTKLENHFRDMQDLEFTIENGVLYILQTRNGKRTADAAINIAVDLVNEGMITKEEAILRVEPKQLDSLLHPQFDQKVLDKIEPLGKGLAASPGAATGHVVFTAEDAKKWHSEGKEVVLVRIETSPEDIEGMAIAQGILTARGGMTSHAAVVARGMGKCCVSGMEALQVDYENRTFSVGNTQLKEGDFISINGTTGLVYNGKIDTVMPTISDNFYLLMEWADSVRTLEVYCNADTPEDALQGKHFGAQGIGLCRTEHMFFEPSRIRAMREMIVSSNETERKRALDKLLPYQLEDFEGMFRAMGEKYVVIRYLDPPLHEFLPTQEEDIEEIAQDLNITIKELKQVIANLHEFNPMMGHRGVRLAISYPEIAIMQTTAVIQAALNVSKEDNIQVTPHIMIPLISDDVELSFIERIVKKTADELIEASGQSLNYKVGTMIEIPRACLIADTLAKTADFFSFGTNDLTQMTFGFSRDDAAKFLEHYYDRRIYENDPFTHVDEKGVGKMIEIATKLGKKTKPNMHIGVCGEHGGDPTSIDLFHRIGVDYVSCSPYRVPVARLAAAQSALKHR